MSDRPKTAANRASAAPDPMVGRVIQDRYTISGLIARGGMGKVYKADQRPLNRVCAVKVLNSNYAGDQDPEFEKRFFLEASIAAKLTHPNTVTVFDYGRTDGDDGFYFMAMEYLEGQTLQRGIREAGFFSEERACHVARQICRALREAHGLGVIHRDLKPANVFLVQHGDETDFVKVLDFGLVKNVSDSQTEDLTQTGLFMGSPKYMAPEQIQGQRVDCRTDIYALGVILYEMLSGKVPFDRPNSVHILMAHVNEAPPDMRTINPSLAISAELESLVASCLSKNMGDRPDTMDAVLTALKRTAGGALTGTMGSYAGTGELRALSVSDANAALGNATGGNRVARTGSVHPPAFSEIPREKTSVPPPEDPPSAMSRVFPAAVGGALVAAILGFFVVQSVSKKESPFAAVPPARAPVELAHAHENGAHETAAIPGAAASAALAAGDAAQVAQVAQVAPPAPPAVLTATLNLRSNPPGASVVDSSGQYRCGPTPCAITISGPGAATGHAITLKFHRDGFFDKETMFAVGQGDPEVILVRFPQAAPVAMPRPQKPAEQPSSAPAAGYKDEPY